MNVDQLRLGQRHLERQRSPKQMARDLGKVNLVQFAEVGGAQSSRGAKLTLIGDNQWFRFGEKRDRNVLGASSGQIRSTALVTIVLMVS